MAHCGHAYVSRRFAQTLRQSPRSLQTCAVSHLLNKFGVDLIGDQYNKILFNGIKCKQVSKAKIEECLSELEKFGLDSGGVSFSLPDVTSRVPSLDGSNILEHFHNVASEQNKPYVDILHELLQADIPPPPNQWKIEPGWTRYGFDGSITTVEYPSEPGTVLDVEVSVRTDPRAVMAVACSSKAWYAWLSPYFVSCSGFPPRFTPASMIPYGSDSSPRLILGHNVSYDRIRIGDEYQIERSGTRFIDTMSMHIAYSGMTSSQRIMKNAESKIDPESRPKWLERTSMNNLADIHMFYCKPRDKIKKDVRDSFVKLSISELREDAENLLTYCSGDVFATLEVAKVLLPKFLKACPHPVTLSGMLTMSTSFLPTDDSWNRYINDAEATFETLEKSLLNKLESEAKNALSLTKNSAYKRDPWLWDLNWNPASKKTKKRRCLDNIADLSNIENYPFWFQDLASEEDGRAFLDITLSKRIVPKLLRLTWKGFPLHFDKVEKWGYLSPAPNIRQVLEDMESGEVISDFPLREYLDNLDKPSCRRISESTDMYIDQISDFSDRGSLTRSNEDASTNNGPDNGKDIGIPGVRFTKLPHKNGPKFRVGNPLGKDFLSACGEGGALTSRIENLARDLLNIGIQLAYWRNARDRLGEQIKVDLDKETLPEEMRSNPNYHEDQIYSVILPALVVSGTVTRRAVEKTWLTASNARTDRVGSELKTAVRAPPGFHFVGADVDSQELWLASVLGDAECGGHGSTPLGWMSLQGERAKGTDLHSKTAAAAQVTRDQAKILNYARIYGAGEQFARLLLKQFNPDLTDAAVGYRAKHMYEQTKGLRGFQLNETGKWLYEFIMDKKDGYSGEMISKKMMNILTKKMVFLNRIVKESKFINHKGKILQCHTLTEDAKHLYFQFRELNEDSTEILLDDGQLKEFYLYLEEQFDDNVHSDFNVLNSLVQQTIWFGGSESNTFNRLEEIAMSPYPKTPVLGASISRALDTKLIGRNYLPSRINWVVQSTAVDFLHLLLASMEWFMHMFSINGRYVISIHDEVRYLVPSKDRYKAAFAFHLSNLFVRSFIVARLGLNNLPASTAFFSSVDVDCVLRKEPSSDCVTPSNPYGLEKGHGVSPGEGLDINQVIEKLSEIDPEKCLIRNRFR